jgi:hypothetical protein
METQSEPRRAPRSRLAAASLWLGLGAPVLLASFVLYMGFVVGMADRAGPDARPFTSGQEWMMGLFWVAIPASVGLSLGAGVISLVQILRAKGALRGLGFALGGIGVSALLAGWYLVTSLGG